MRELEISFDGEALRQTNALMEKIPPDDVYMYLWLLLDNWCTRDIQLFERNTPAFMQMYEENADALVLSSFCHSLMEEILEETCDEHT